MRMCREYIERQMEDGMRRGRGKEVNVRLRENVRAMVR